VSGQSVVLASGNKGKLAELELLLAPLGFELSLQSEFSVPDADETGLSFIENAILKARHASAITGLPALADDSGIEVDALHGMPGIYSARFSRLEANNQNDGNDSADNVDGVDINAANNALLLDKLKGVATQQRTARFRCVLALMRHAHDPSPLIAEGSWEGRILEAPAGTGGFGYDPLFFATAQQCAAAELPPEKKAGLSHRGQAMRRLLGILDNQQIFSKSNASV